MNERMRNDEKTALYKEKLEDSFVDLLIQLSEIEYGEASLTCIVKENELVFAGVSRTKNIMFNKQRK